MRHYTTRLPLLTAAAAVNLAGTMDPRRRPVLERKLDTTNHHHHHHQHRRGQNRPPNIYAAYAGAVPDVDGNAILQTDTMWWDEERIEATVNRQFVLSQLRPDEQSRLDQHLEFGDVLTDYTYLEWILEKAKRIFLILVDLDVPDQIFGVVDDSWDDDDLPVPMDQIERLQLTYDKDERLEKRFFQRQFTYLLRYIHEGELIFYDDVEVVPLEYVDKRPVVGLANTTVDKVHLPGRPDNVYLRRRVPLGLGDAQMPQEEFLSGMEQMKAMQHKHLISLWACYIHHSVGYVLLTPVNDGTLKSFLTVTPPSIKILAKQDRRILFLNWLHCLADALAFLHGQGLSHRKIKPSNVMMDIDNEIYLADCSIFTDHQSSDSKKSFDKETYDFASPEQWSLPTTSQPRIFTARLPRKVTVPSNSSASPVSDRPSSSGDSIYTSSTGTGPSTGTSPTDTHSILYPASRTMDPQKSDIFSIGCIFLEIISALLKRPSRNFVSHRSAKNKTPGRGGGLPDSSFHKNLGQVESWIMLLLKDAKKKEDRIFRGISPILDLITRMLAVNPAERPTAQAVNERMFDILTRMSGIEEPHCGLRSRWAKGPGTAQMSIAESQGLRHKTLHARVNSDTTAADTASVAPQRNSVSANTIKLPERTKSNGAYKGRGGIQDTTRNKAKPKAWQAPVYAEFSFGT